MNGRIEQAIEQLKSGGEKSFHLALENLTASAFAFAKKMCGNKQDAEDIAQETMIQLAPSITKFSDARGLGVWLYKVAKTRCLMSRRSGKFAPVRVLSLDDMMPQGGDSSPSTFADWPENPEDLILRRELRQQLEKAILDLPEAYRMVLVLRDMEQLDTQEVAKTLGISQATVKMRLHRARVFVRNALDHYIHSVSDEKQQNG
ncbi:MAG TPA: RNA polymerase sigma factor [Terriglobia bacterium]|nr:RNA polymerase sigma factor [Terriglobia bacterium]